VLGTAVSDLEVDSEDTVGTMWQILYPFVDGPQPSRDKDGNPVNFTQTMIGKVSSVKITDDGCAVATPTATAGAVTFSLANTGSDVNEFEIDSRPGEGTRIAITRWK